MLKKSFVEVTFIRPWRGYIIGRTEIMPRNVASMMKRNGYVSIKDTSPMPEKRKRGRPRKAENAVIQ